MNWNARIVNRWTLALSACGIALGIAGHLTGYEHLAQASWAATTVLALAPLTASTLQALLRGQAGVDIIALLAMAGSLALGQYLAGAVIALMLAGGQALEHFAASLARKELSALLQRAPHAAHRYDGAALMTVDVEAVRLGDLLLVKPGEVVPVDGVVVGAGAVLDEAALTGESLPVEHGEGQQVRSGAVNISHAPFTMRAITTARDSTYAGIVRLVEQAQVSKAPLVRIADRYSMFFLPVALAIAGLAWLLSGDPLRALAVLVVATPCPLILAAPVAIVSGISRAARRGIIVKGGGALETLARGKILVLDKTGTITGGSPAVTDIESFHHYGADELLHFAASLDQVSPHVLAAPILRAARERKLALSFPDDVREELGLGIRGFVDGHLVALGRSDWVTPDRPPAPQLRRLRRRTLLEGSSSVAVAIDGELAGVLILEDPVRPDAPFTLRSLRQAGFARIVMLTGDHEDIARAVGAALGVDEVLAGRSPAEKVKAVRESRLSGVTVMVGDGVNDAPSLAAADVGVALGARGATASSEAADVVLVVDRLDRLVEGVRIARRSRHIAMQSIFAGMGLSAAAMGIAAGGWLAPVAGALVQEVIDVLVILNALRALAGTRSTRLPDTAISNMGRQFRAEHRRLLPGVKRIRQLADRLENLPAVEMRNELGGIYRFLTNEILPHDEAEDARVYPVVAKLIGGDDPTATMTRAHLEIAHLINVLGRTIDDLPGEPDSEDTGELRRILYSLDAILRLHFAQEEESYLALIDERCGVEFEEVTRR